MAMLWMQPDEITSLYASVAATVDDDYEADWLCDGRVGRPLRGTSGSSSATITPLAAGEVGMIVVCNHMLDAGKAVTFGGGITATVTNGAVPANGIRQNPFTTITPVPGVSSVTMSVSGNSTDIVIGEVFFGKYRSIRGLRFDSDHEEHDHTLEVAAEFGSIMPYDRGLESRKVSGYQYYTTAERNQLIEWHRAQRSGSRPSVVVLDDDVNDAMVGRLMPLSYSKAGPDLWRVDVTFEEFKRGRW